ncbi:MAG: hypothetical protein KAS32_27210 [Candidatus Peribacteraceae bacterium]|nr:hypothetical protein [Candidatus Peribacteraceae bacterium]
MKKPEDKTPLRLEHNPDIDAVDQIRDILNKVLGHAVLGHDDKEYMRLIVGRILQDEEDVERLKKMSFRNFNK